MSTAVADVIVQQLAKDGYHSHPSASDFTTALKVLIEKLDIPDTFYESVSTYSVGLHSKALENYGLSHAKVREYWLYRGPRIIGTFLLFLCGNLLIQIFVFGITNAQIQSQIAVSSLALFTALIMLYYRLPDSIASGISRSAHDHYVASKNLLSSNGKNNGVLDTCQLEIV
jgi:hypothetical protein